MGMNIQRKRGYFMKILMLVDDINIGGTATHILSISKKLIEMDIDIYIIAKCGDLHKEFEDIGVEVKYLDLTKNLKEVSEEIIEIIREKNIDLIHTHLIRSIEIANYIHKVIKIDYIATIHILGYDKQTLNLLKDAKHIICVSEPIKVMLLANIDYDISKKISTIYNSIEINNNVDKVKKSKYKVITYCSRLSMVKGVIAERVINEVYEIAKSDNNVIVLIIGDGNKKSSIDFYANYINMELKRKAIYVLGNIHNPQRYFRISDCVIGTGRVLIETINLNVACVAFGSKGFVGVVEPESYEIMLQTYFGEHEKVKKNNNKSLSESIRYILYQANIECITQNNKQWCTIHFDENKSIEKLLKIVNKKGAN